MNPALRLAGVHKRFGQTIAVDNLDLVVPAGGLYGVIGPNGAGKTTTIRMIMSILFPDAGELSVLGHRSALEAKDRIGYLPEERGVYRKMLVGAFLTYMARLKGVRDADAGRARAAVASNAWNWPAPRRNAARSFQRARFRRSRFVAAIIHEPDLLILDEPFSGLDPVSTRLLRDIVIAEQRRGATILFSTHVMHQAEEVCEHVVMIHRGRKVLDEPINTIRRRFDPRMVRFEPLDADADISPLRALREVERVERGAHGYDVILTAGSDPGAALQRIAAAVPPSRIELARLRLEDVFVSIVSNREAAAARAHDGSGTEVAS